MPEKESVIIELKLDDLENVGSAMTGKFRLQVSSSMFNMLSQMKKEAPK